MDPQIVGYPDPIRYPEYSKSPFNESCPPTVLLKQESPQRPATPTNPKLMISPATPVYSTLRRFPPSITLTKLGYPWVLGGLDCGANLGGSTWSFMVLTNQL